MFLKKKKKTHTDHFIVLLNANHSLYNVYYMELSLYNNRTKVAVNLDLFTYCLCSLKYMQLATLKYKI